MGRNALVVLRAVAFEPFLATVLSLALGRLVAGFVLGWFMSFTNTITGKTEQIRPYDGVIVEAAVIADQIVKSLYS